jgi:hypothetical protein
LSGPEAVLARAGIDRQRAVVLEDPDSGQIAEGWRRVPPGGALVVGRSGLLARLRSAPEVPPALQLLAEAGPWRAYRVPPPEELRPHPQVVVREADGGLFLVHLASGATFRLNGAGKAVWDALSGGRTVEEVVPTLRGAPPDRIRADVDALIGDLVDAGLLVAP